jgi:hypothetical protein
MKLPIVVKSLAAALLTAAASFACTITPEIPAAQMGRLVASGAPPVTSQPFPIPVSVSAGCTLTFVGLFNAYPLVATFGPLANQPGKVGITLADSGALLPVVPFNATGMAVFQATDSSGQTTTGTLTVYFYGIAGS